MIVFLNGKFVPEERAVVSIFDRAFLLGDGLFETILIFNGKPFCWQEHLKRLQCGTKFLKIKLPFMPKQLRDAADKLIAKNKMSNALLRIVLSRGVGQRGYLPKGANQPTLVMSLHRAPELNFKNPPPWKLITSSFRLPANEPLAQFKTCNKLSQIMARAEADAAGADEALLLNTDGFVVEGASSNLFWIEGKTVCTPPLAAGILAGVTRGTILKICRRLKIPIREKNVQPKDLARKDGAFVSLSSFGIVEAKSLNRKILKRSPLTKQIARAYNEILTQEIE